MKLKLILIFSFLIVSANNTWSQTSLTKIAVKKVWCDTILSANANPAYTLAYNSPDKFTIMYDESRIGINRDSKNYRLILKQSVNNKDLFIIVDNGKVTESLPKLTNNNIIGGLRQPLDGLNTAIPKSGNEKYIIAETSTTTIAGQKATTVTTPQNINTKQIASGYEIMKNTDEYKKMSPEEKKQIDDAMKMMPQAATDYANSGVAGKTITTPDVKGGSYTGANGYYSIVVKGKKYGRFLGPPELQISADETNVYIVAADSTGRTSFIANGKTILLDPKSAAPMGHIGKLIMSQDGKKAAFVELKPMTEKENEEMLKNMQNGGSLKQTFIVTKSDGTVVQITRSDGGDDFKVTNTGAIVFVNTKTGEISADGRMIGKFTSSGNDFNTAGLLFGSDPSKITYYNEDGSLSFMDGTKKDMGILFPQVFVENGKSFITWFRKCNNTIYIGKYTF